MNSAAPRILAVETDSAWVVILAVSVVTLAASLALRRLINRPGGLASGLLLAMPLVLPLVAAAAYQQPVLPEIAVLERVVGALGRESSQILHLVLFTDRANEVVRPYAVSGSAGPWLVVVGSLASSIMLVRRAAGWWTTRRLLRRCSPLGPHDLAVADAVARLAEDAGLRSVPEVLFLPEGTIGAFAVAGGRGRILLARDLVAGLDRDELRGILGHEIAHLEAHDVRVVVVAGLLRDMMAWNPVAHVCYRRLCADREFEADRRAAALTGTPLAVASGLLKVCELGPARALRAAGIGFMHPGRMVSRRVGRLLAVADGRTVAQPAASTPYFAALALVTALGLHAGAVVARDADPVAIVWGNPSIEASSVVWAPAKLEHHSEGQGGDRVAVPRKSPDHSGRYPVPAFLRAEAVGEKDVPRWIKRVTRWTERHGVSPALLRWEHRVSWVLDKPLLRPADAVTVYRMQIGNL